MAIETLQYGTVTGRYLAAVADTIWDEDTLPDEKPMTGTVIFSPNVSSLLLADSSNGGPATIALHPITASLDAEGYLYHNGSRGVTLIASDNPFTNPSDFTWSVTPVLSYENVQLRLGTWNIRVSSTGINDLTTLAPVPGTSGTAITRGVGIMSARQENGALILRLDTGTELAPVTLPPGSGVHVQTTNPQMVAPGLWIQTGLGTSGTDFTFWIEDGS